jgi:ribosomal protein S18 acetylase RimI-like enzyme
MYIESVTSKDRGSLLAIATSTGLFTPEEAEALLGDVIDKLNTGSMPAGHQAVSCRLNVNEAPVGWSYFAPDQHAANVWNLWWIGVSPRGQGTGVGTHLLQHAEHTIAAFGARLLIIETSAAAPLASARSFYEANGYLACGRVPDFYGEGEAKVIYARRPRSA